MRQDDSLAQAQFVMAPCWSWSTPPIRLDSAGRNQDVVATSVIFVAADMVAQHP